MLTPKEESTVAFLEDCKVEGLAGWNIVWLLCFDEKEIYFSHVHIYCYFFIWLNSGQQFFFIYSGINNVRIIFLNDNLPD